MNRSVQHRCPNMGRLMASKNSSCGCPKHQYLPIPCDECYSLIVTSERVPYQPSEPWGPVDQRERNGE